MMTQEEQPELLTKHEGFIFQCAQFWAAKNSWVSFDDLMQEGRMALLFAAKRHDGRGSLLTYAVWYIRRAMRVHVMSFETPVRLGDHTFNRVKDMKGAFARCPLDQPMGSDSTETLGDRLRMPEPEVEMSQMADVKALVEAELLKLKPQQRAVIKARYLDEKKLRDMKAEFGLSHQRLSQIERKALGILRNSRILKNA